MKATGSEVDTITGETVTYYEVLVYCYETDSFEVWNVENDILEDENEIISVSDRYYINYYWNADGNKEEYRTEALNATAEVRSSEAEKPVISSVVFTEEIENTEVVTFDILCFEKMNRHKLE